MLTLTLVSVQGANYTVYLKHIEFVKNCKHLLKDSNVNTNVIFQAQSVEDLQTVISRHYQKDKRRSSFVMYLLCKSIIH